ncbi:MAG: ATP-binding protein [Actinomycetota bacterium]
MSKVEPIRTDGSPREAVVADQIESVIRRLGPVLHTHNVYVEADPDLTAICDSRALTRVLENLLLNAHAFSPSGSTICIRAQRFSRGKVIVSVEDTGIGIPVEDSERIFEPFYSGHDSLNPGTGVGLSIVKEFAKDLGGAVWMESCPGRGSTFSFTMLAATE